jgi:hypothetical protein
MRLLKILIKENKALFNEWSMVNIIIDSNQLHAFMGETWHCAELLYWSLEGEGRGDGDFNLLQFILVLENSMLEMD